MSTINTPLSFALVALQAQQAEKDGSRATRKAEHELARTRTVTEYQEKNLATQLELEQSKLELVMAGVDVVSSAMSASAPSASAPSPDVTSNPVEESQVPPAEEVDDASFGDSLKDLLKGGFDQGAELYKQQLGYRQEDNADREQNAKQGEDAAKKLVQIENRGQDDLRELKRRIWSLLTNQDQRNGQE